MESKIRVTVDEMLSHGPCQPDYPRERVEELWSGREALTPQEIYDLRIPPLDRWWALAHVMPHRWLVARSCDFAEHVLPIWKAAHPDDACLRHAIETTRAWLRGEATIEQVVAARIAARSAADTVCATDAAYDARYAARAASHAAHAASRADTAAWWSSVYVDACARVAALADAAELEWQEARVRETLSDAEKEETDHA